MTPRLVLAAVLWTVASLSAQAQTVKVEFQMGKVNLVAQNASLRAILTEWARVGGMRLINPERLTGAPMTLELTGVPERQALDILMREVGGYIVGPRPALVQGVSSFDRLVVVSAVAGRPAPSPAFPAPRPSPQLGRVATPIEREPIVNDDDDDDPDPDNAERAEPAARTRPGQPALSPGLPPLPRTQDAPAPEAPRPTPGNPFGVVPGAARPGAITPVVQPPADQRQPAENQPSPNQ